MIHYRITKFAPNKRNDKGHFLDDSEWASISDIGNPKCNFLTYQEYERIESAYVESIKLILREKSIRHLQIDSLELHNSFVDFENFKESGRLKNITFDFGEDIKSLENGEVLEIGKVDKIVRLILREMIWMNLLAHDLKVSFGYDYYSYVECEELNGSTIQQIEKMGLFVEPDTGPIIFEFVDAKGDQ